MSETKDKVGEKGTPGGASRGGSSAEGGDKGLRVGIAFASHAGMLRERLDAMCAALESAIGVPAKGIGLWHYHRLSEALDAGDVDIAWLPPALAIYAMARGSVHPILLPVRSGVSLYHAALFARGDSVWQKPEDLRGARAAWVDRRSAGGYLVIRAHLRSLGINLDRAFSAEQFVGAHDAVARAVLDGDADVGATFAHIDRNTKKILRAGWGDAKVTVLAQAGPIPSDVLAASTHVPRETREKLAEVLLDPRPSPVRRAALDLFEADGFLAPKDEHFETLRRLLSNLDDFANIVGSTPPR